VWSEWNGKYRDTVRDFWRGEPATLPELASRLTGSSDLYEDDSRRPVASINFVTAHDGFTLADLVAFNDKHNEANGEDNRDGESFNRSWNCGVEGPSTDAKVVALRRRQQRNFITTLFVSQGVPMLLGGDELGRTQGGNNNAYCQDSEISWFDWSHVDDELREFAQEMIAFRREHHVFRRRHWFQGKPIRGTVDIGWLRPDGTEMDDADWEAGFAKAMAVFLNGDTLSERDPRGQPVTDDSFLLIFNADDAPVDFTLPSQWGGTWEVVVETSGAIERGKPATTPLAVADRSVVVLVRRVDR
jgi:glycogen operon protein